MTQATFEGRDEKRASTRSAWTEVIAGIVLVLVEHLLVGGMIGGAGVALDQFVGGRGDWMVVFFVWLFGIGLTQLGYVFPTFVIALITRRNVAAGVALGAMLTFLLNGACFGALCGVGVGM